MCREAATLVEGRGLYVGDGEPFVGSLGFKALVFVFVFLKRLMFQGDEAAWNPEPHLPGQGLTFLSR